MALETVRAIDSVLGSEAGRGLDVTLLAPRHATVPPFERIAIRKAGMFKRGYAWEQLDLPRLTLGGVLLNLCNLGPVLSIGRSWSFTTPRRASCRRLFRPASA